MEINTEITHKLILESLSLEEIQHIKDQMAKSWKIIAGELKQLFINLKQSEAHTSDGDLIRILMDAGYARLYKWQGYWGISCQILHEALVQNQRDNEEYEKYYLNHNEEETSSL